MCTFLTYRNIEPTFKKIGVIKMLSRIHLLVSFALFKLLGRRRKMQVRESPQSSRNWNVFKSRQSQASLSSSKGDVLKSPTVLRITQTLLE